jgi:hypothetical protein
VSDPLPPCLQIEFPNPDRRQKRLIFQACTSKMNLSEEVDLEVRGVLATLACCWLRRRGAWCVVGA